MKLSTVSVQHLIKSSDYCEEILELFLAFCVCVHVCVHMLAFVYFLLLVYVTCRGMMEICHPALVHLNLSDLKVL